MILFSENTPSLTHKNVANMYWKGEVEEELRDENHIWRMKWVMNSEGDLDNLMKDIVEEHSGETYTHQQSKDCHAKGAIL